MCSCINHANDKRNISYSIRSVMPEDIKTFADSNKCEYTAICTYQKMCPLSVKEFPRILDFCDSIALDLYVLFTVRESDSLYIYESIEEIKKHNSTFNNFMILNDSLYDSDNKVRKKILFKEYGGPREGQKYIKYVDSFLPSHFDNGCYTPRLFLYRKGKGIIFATQYYEDEKTCFSNHDIEQIIHIVSDNSDN